MSILAFVLTAAGQALAGFYATMELQKERTAAVESSRSVLDAVREKRGEFQEDFPTSLIGWIESENDGGWERYLLTEHTHGGLPDHRIEVVCMNMEDKEAGPGDNPIKVYATSYWTAMAGRETRAVVATYMSDR